MILNYNRKNKTQFYHFGGYAACQIMVNYGNSILREMDIKLYIGSTLQKYN